MTKASFHIYNSPSKLSRVRRIVGAAWPVLIRLNHGLRTWEAYKSQSSKSELKFKSQSKEEYKAGKTNDSVLYWNLRWMESLNENDYM